MTFGERLTNLRKEYGYKSRNDFANKLGIPSTTLRNYETDAREPGHTFLKQISEFFNVSVDYLLCLTDEKEVLHTFRLRSCEQNMVEKYRYIENHSPEGVGTVNYILDREYSVAKQITELSIPKAQTNITLDPRDTDALSAAVREAEESYIKSRSGSARRKDLSASNITDGEDKEAVNT